MRWRDRCFSWVVATAASTALVVGFFLWALEAKAQEAPEAPTEAPAEPLEGAPTVDEAPEGVEAAFSAEELQALVAPVALYPDLVLVLALQASLAPSTLSRRIDFSLSTPKIRRSSPTPTGTRA